MRVEFKSIIDEIVDVTDAAKMNERTITKIFLTEYEVRLLRSELNQLGAKAAMVNQPKISRDLLGIINGVEIWR